MGKQECHSCGDFSNLPLSDRHWCHDCEAEAQNVAHYSPEAIDEILKGMRG